MNLWTLPDHYLGNISSVTLVSWEEPGIILHPISCLVERQSGYSSICFQCGCCCSSVEKIIFGRSFENVLGQSLVPVNVFYIPSWSSASLKRHLPGTEGVYPSTHELGAALWFQPQQVVQERMPLLSHHCWLAYLQKIFPPHRNSLSPIFPRWWCKGSLYKSVRRIELRPTGMSYVNKLTDLLLTTTSNSCHFLK